MICLSKTTVVILVIVLGLGLYSIHLKIQEIIRRAYTYKYEEMLTVMKHTADAVIALNRDILVLSENINELKRKIDERD